MIPRTRYKPTRQAGFSLVELMIAMTLGLLLTAAVGALFFANKRNYNQNTLIAEMQDNGRFALQALSRDLMMSGYLGGLMDNGQLDATSATIPALAQDCGPGPDGDGAWAFDTEGLVFSDNVDAAGIGTVYSCLSGADGSLVMPGTDIVGVRRVSGIQAGFHETGGTAPTLAANTFYLRTNRTVGSLFYSGGDATNPAGNHPPNTPPTSFWEYTARLYFLRPYARTPGDGIPTLCRAFLAHQASPTVDIECIAEGVENLQIAFGVDTDTDGTANRYLTDPTLAQLDNAVTARIQLLMRSTGRDPSYTNDKRYNLLGIDDDGDGEIDESGEGVAPADNFYRRIRQITVVLKNPAIAQGFSP